MAIKRTKRNSRPLSSAEIIAYNDDLLTEILCLLPIKSLFRCKSVCKNWQSLISSSYFFQRLNLVPKPISGLFVPCVSRGRQYEFINLSSSPSTAPFQLLSFRANSSPINVLQSCNGLLLCRTLKAEASTRKLLNRFKYYYVYNPTTEKYTIIRKIPANPGARRSYVYLAFDPSKSTHYKAICLKSVCDSLEDSQYQVEVYSSKTGTWRQSDCSFTVPLDANLADGVFWNGSLHWLSARSPPFYFIVDEEKLGAMPKPPIPDGWECKDRIFRFLCESRGHLHLVESYDIYQIEVSEIDKDYSRWSMKYQVELDEVATTFPEMFNWFSILSLVREENDDNSYFVLHFPGKVIRYNLKNKTSKMLHNSIPAGSIIGHISEVEHLWPNAFQYIESPACVHDVSVQELV